ncbi:MerR family transcriptional regulator [Neobacillus notoginsengisoli]|uniref:MerR family transcriptional regulator n=1 Tax=Neobacillus notoginsengisoli TaxID=1578198 RepID=UPI001314A5D6|nr:MerR family transcriptional regulator [Neobacillus notoginsengisoli]
MKHGKGKYNIKAASAILGIKPGTLRAWENRYKIVSPDRNESGHRLYSEDQISQLNKVLEKLEQGFTISQAAVMLEERDNRPRAMKTSQTQIDQYIQNLIEAFHHFDEESSHFVLDNCFKLFTIETVLADLILPVIKELDALRETGQIAESSYYFGLALLRTRIDSPLFCTGNNKRQPKALAICVPGQSNELELLCLLCYLKLKGFQAIFLGCSVDEKDLSFAIKKFKPHYLFLSMSPGENIDTFLSSAAQFGKSFPWLKIGLAGSGFLLSNMSQSEKVKDKLIGASPEEWERWLVNKNALNE